MINFPTSLDTLSNPVGTDKVNNAVAALKHATQHANANDAIEALEAKVGINGSAVTTSHDYKLSSVTGTDKSVSKSSSNFVGGKVMVSSGNNGIVETTLELNNDGILDIASGGTGVTLTDPGQDSLMGWDNTANEVTFITVGSGLNLTGNTLTTSGTNLSRTFTAMENLTAGDKVGISNFTGGVSRTGTLGYFTESSFTAPSSPGGYSTIQVATDKILTIYEDQTSNDLLAIVSIVDRTDLQNALSFSSPVTISTNVTVGNLYGYYACKLDTDKVLISYTNPAASTQVMCVVGTISGTTLTLGTPQLVDTTAVGTSQIQIWAAQIGTDKAVITYMAVVSGTPTSKTVALTVSGTVATIGTPVSLNASLSDQFNRVVKVATDKFAVMNGNYLQVGTISGTTITLGTAVQTFTTAGAGAELISSILVSPDTNVVVIAENVGSSTYKAIACTISGTTITVGTAVTLAGTTTGALYAVSPTELYVGSGASTYSRLTLSGTTLTNNGVIAKLYLTDNMVDMSGYFLVLKPTASNPVRYVLSGYANNFMGIVQASATLGNPVSIVYKGIDINQSGLIAGSYYTIGNGGTLTFTATDTANLDTIQEQTRVLAVSDTEIILP
jgi:hypothetical protein